MKIRFLTAAALLVAAGAQGKSAAERHLTVYVRNGIVVPYIIKAQAEALASNIFAGIGVKLDLRESRPLPSETAAIVIELADLTPAGFLPGAWAYALPFEGVHIRIFWDRLQLEARPQNLLAHVMVHEITHILQGSDRHSNEGIMQARWTARERGALERTPLRFTDTDVDLIYRGMDARGSRPARQVLAAMPLNAASMSVVQ